MAIVSYGSNAFLEVFYQNLGKDSLKPYETGLRNLFHTIKENLPQEIKKIDNAKEAIEQALEEFK